MLVDDHVVHVLAAVSGGGGHRPGNRAPSHAHVVHAQGNVVNITADRFDGAIGPATGNT